jgi:glutathionylspermidine synthase
LKRIATEPRQEWRQKVEEAGLIFHTTPEGVYWNEAAHYSFSMGEVLMLEQVTNDLHAMCLQAAQHVIDKNLFAQLGIPPNAAELIKETWEEEPPAIYGRFDLAYDGIHPPKMLEYNADTPTSLLEAAVVQWFWLQELDPGSLAQFNSIHERLVAKWKELKSYIKGSTLYFGHAGTHEDIMTIAYIANTAMEAGIHTQEIAMKDIGWERQRHHFVDLSGRQIGSIFKLYPWEWLVHEEFAPQLSESRKKTQWIEPAWKMLLSNKGILPILWQLFPNHPNLLPCYFGDPHGMKDYVRKPLLSREGANVEIYSSGTIVESQGGDYGEEGYVCQARAVLPNFNGNYPVIGSWVIDGEAAGMGIREADTLITGNLSRFVPHRID